MEENYFTRLSAIECVTEKRKSGSTELTYVSWADAWSDLKKVYPDAQYKIYEDANGFPFWSSKYGIDVKVGVTVNGLEHVVRLPVMDGNNNAMKDEAYEYTTNYGKKRVEAADTFDINKAIQRCFAKACAMHGLGLYVYRGEDLPDSEDNKEKASPSIIPATEKPTLKTLYVNAYQSSEYSNEFSALVEAVKSGKFKTAEECIAAANKKYNLPWATVEAINKLFN